MYERIFKLSGERFPLLGSIVNPRATNEVVVLSSSSVSAKDNTGADVSTTLLDQTTKAVVDHPIRDDGQDSCLSIRVRAGTTAKSPYIITFTLATNQANIYQVGCQLVVKT
jgi:hypothetical protein